MTTSGALDEGQRGSRADPKWLIGELVVRKGSIARWHATIGWIGVVSHHLRLFHTT